MKKNKISLICALMAAVFLLFSACSTSKNETLKEKPIQIALTQDMLSFDPVLTSDIFSEAVLRCVYTSLYDFDDDLNLRPKLVKSSVIVDSCTWRLEIHDNVKFHDGSSLTTDDVIFSIERALHGARTEKLLEIIDNVEKIDDTTFLIRSKEPCPDLLSIFAKAETSIVSKAVVETPGYDFSMPVGAGPFKLITREENSKICLERFDDYFLEKAASRYLNFVVLVTEQERTASFLNSDVDILFSVSAYDCEKLRLSQGVKLLSTPSTKIEYLSLNTQHPPLDNSKVRLAISCAINRENITSGVYRGYSTPTSSLIPKGIIGYIESPISYDPERAKMLLKEAGYEDGFEFTVITINTIRKNTLEYIKLDLAKVGILLNYNLVTMKEAGELMMANEHAGILVGWAFNSNPNSVLPLLLGTGSGKTMNSSNYSNPEVDELLMKGQEEADPETRRQIYEKINKIVVEDSPIVILQNPMILCAVRDNIEGTHLNPQGLIQYESLYRK